MKKIVIILIFLSMALGAAAQSAPALLIGSDPVAFGRGGAALAMPASAYAADNNAAAMALSADKFNIAATYGMWAPKAADNTVIGLGTYFRIGEKFALGLSGRMLRDKPYDITTSAGQVTGTFTPNDLVVGLGLSYAVSDNFSLGLSGRMLSSKIGKELSGNSFAADITAIYNVILGEQ